MTTTYNFEIEIREAHGKSYAFLSLSNNFDKEHITRFEEIIEPLFQSEHAYLVLDLGEIDLISSHAMSYFESLHRKLDVAEKRLALVNANEEVREILEFVGLSKIIEIFDEEKKFVEAVQREEI